jgi:hypothetical protein
MMTHGELSERVMARIREDFSPTDQERVCELLKTIEWKESPKATDRIHWDILLLAEGKMERVRVAVEVAKQDPHDLFMAAEYGKPEYVFGKPKILTDFH